MSDQQVPRRTAFTSLDRNDADGALGAAARLALLLLIGAAIAFGSVVLGGESASAEEFCEPVPSGKFYLSP